MKLNLETYIALVGSVEKWFRVAHEGENINHATCALCDLDERLTCPTCRCCPIMDQTGYGGCQSTPFWRASMDYPGAKVDMLIFLLDLEESVTHVDGERI